MILWTNLLESIQGICKSPTYRFEDTIVWERCISEDLKSISITVWYSASEVFVHFPCPSSNLVYRSFESTLVIPPQTQYHWRTRSSKLCQINFMEVSMKIDLLGSNDHRGYIPPWDKLFSSIVFLFHNHTQLLINFTCLPLIWVLNLLNIIAIVMYYYTLVHVFVLKLFN